MYKSDLFIFNNLYDKVMTYINMLGSAVLDKIFRDIDSDHVVTV